MNSERQNERRFRDRRFSSSSDKLYHFTLWNYLFQIWKMPKQQWKKAVNVWKCIPFKYKTKKIGENIFMTSKAKRQIKRRTFMLEGTYQIDLINKGCQPKPNNWKFVRYISMIGGSKKLFILYDLSQFQSFTGFL